MTAQDPPALDVHPVLDLQELDVVARTADGSPELSGSRCSSCGDLAFPPQDRCRRCFAEIRDAVSLGDRATLYAFSTVHVSSSMVVPYTLAYVDLPSGVRLLTRLFGDVDDFAIGDDVVLEVDQTGEWGFRRANGS